ncbi:MAG: alpha/beta fold hydrolase [Sulfuritalea sp.]|nr:alpha/beta fold hydrolase [Sulfuritalea sp.]
MCGGTLSQNALGLKRYIAAQVAPGSSARIHLVGHSLGGLVILEMLRHEPDLRLRRAVLLGTPCVDSHCARRLAGNGGHARAVSIPSSSGCLAFPASLPRRALPWKSASSPARAAWVWAAWCPAPRPNDGWWLSRRTRLPGAAGCIALPVAHSEMLAPRRCAAQIAIFLETGRFLHDEQI